MKLNFGDLQNVDSFPTADYARAVGTLTFDCTVKCDDTQQRTCGYTDCTCLLGQRCPLSVQREAPQPIEAAALLWSCNATAGRVNDGSVTAHHTW